MPLARSYFEPLALISYSRIVRSCEPLRFLRMDIGPSDLAERLEITKYDVSAR